MDRYSYVRQITIENNLLMLRGIEMIKEMDEHGKFSLLVLLVPSHAWGQRSRLLACVNLSLYIEVLTNLAVLHNRQKTIREMAVHNGYHNALRLEGLMP